MKSEKVESQKSKVIRLEGPQSLIAHCPVFMVVVMIAVGSVYVGFAVDADAVIFVDDE